MIQTPAVPRPTHAEPEATPRREAAPSLREILFASDLSHASDAAFDHARHLAEAFGAHLTVYHAVEVKPAPTGGPRDPAVERWRREARWARETLGRLVEPVTARTDLVVEQVRDVDRALLTRIDALRPDVVVMATHGREGIAHLMLGSVTESVLHRAEVPVLCVREPAHGRALPYRRLLLPTDLSPASTTAFPLAARLQAAFDAEVVPIHVAQTPPVRRLWGVPDAVESSVPSEDAVARFVAPWLSDAAIRPIVESGEPWRRIVGAATEEHADLIVMATRGHDSLSDRILGSQTERVVRHAACPVLVTR